VLKITSLTDETELDNLAAGEEARVLLRFCFRPELIFDEDKKKMVFKESKTKGVGSIVSTTDTIHEPIDNKLVTKDNKTRPSRKQRRLLREQRNKGMEASFTPTRQSVEDIKVKAGKMVI
jgi:hypothetical protein